MTTKFKAGDKVRVLKTGACSARVTEGEIGIHTGNGHRVNFPDQNDWWMISDSYLAPADQPVEENPWKENTGEMPVPKGTLVEVIHEDGDVCIGKAGEYGYAHRWDLGCGAGTIRKWRLVPDEKISEKSVDGTLEMTVVLPQQNETTNTQEEKHMIIETGAQVIIKKSVEDFARGSNGNMLRAQSQGTVLTVKRIDGDGDIVVDHADWDRPAYVREHEIELASAAATSEQVVWEVAPKLVPFCVEASETTARQANELLVLAKKLGARVVESVYDDELDEDDVDGEFPDLEESSKYDLDNYNFVGVDNDNDTYTYDDTDNYNNNVMTYADAKKMLEGVKAEAKTSTKQGVKRVAKAELKSFYVRIADVRGDASKINAVFDRLIALGVKVRDVAYDDDLTHEVVSAKYPRRAGARCKTDSFNLFGLKEAGGEFVTYINDVPSEWDDKAVRMTVEELNAYLDALEGKGSKPKARVLRQRKLQIVYTNDKPYLLKNVIGVDIKTDTSTVNVTYKQRKGKVVHNNNVVIPFSELKSVKFVGPDTIGAEYIFKDGKVVKMIQDFTYEAFTHKSH